MEKHTKGPWHFSESEGPAHEYRAYISPINLLVPEEIKDIDAFLIAAAPELLDALENLMRETDQGTQLCAEHFSLAALRAIAKAKGEFDVKPVSKRAS